MFSKMQNSPAFESLRISTARKNKKMSARFHEKLDFLVFFHENCIIKVTFKLEI